jgi:hypothetical protein
MAQMVRRRMPERTLVPAGPLEVPRLQRQEVFEASRRMPMRLLVVRHGERLRDMIEPIRAELFGGDVCTCESLTAKASAPALAMCRKLLAVGYDPQRPLHAYRGEMLCLTITSIGWGALHTITETGAAPKIAAWKPFLDAR